MRILALTAICGLLAAQSTIRPPDQTAPPKATPPPATPAPPSPSEQGAGDYRFVTSINEVVAPVVMEVGLKAALMFGGERTVALVW